MDDTTCELPDCDQPRYQRRSMCASHTMKMYRHGDPYWTKPPTYIDRVGERYGRLTVIRRDRNRWVCLCDCGAETRVNGPDLTRGHIYTCGNARIHWRTTSPGYNVVHRWVVTDRGSARTHTCVDCARPARHWSYDNADPDELAEVAETGREIRYSADINHYEPRCVPCHKRFDLDDRIRRGEPAVIQPPRGYRKSPDNG